MSMNASRPAKAAISSNRPAIVFRERPKPARDGGRHGSCVPLTIATSSGGCITATSSGGRISPGRGREQGTRSPRAARDCGGEAPRRSGSTLRVRTLSSPTPVIISLPSPPGRSGAAGVSSNTIRGPSWRWQPAPRCPSGRGSVQQSETSRLGATEPGLDAPAVRHGCDGPDADCSRLARGSLARCCQAGDAETDAAAKAFVLPRCVASCAATSLRGLVPA